MVIAWNNLTVAQQDHLIQLAQQSRAGMVAFQMAIAKQRACNRQAPVNVAGAGTTYLPAGYAYGHAELQCKKRRALPMTSWRR